jgi:hypothetical protein
VCSSDLILWIPLPKNTITYTITLTVLMRLTQRLTLGFVEIPSWPRGANWSHRADWRVGIWPHWASLTRIPLRTV